MVGMVGISASLIIQSILFPGMYTSGWNIWLCAALFPAFGFSLGFAFAKLARRDIKVSKAIAFETGSQNVALAITVLFLTFPYSILEQATAFPQLYAIIMLSLYGIMCGCYNLYVKFCSSKDETAAAAATDKPCESTESKVPDKKGGVEMVEMAIAKQTA